MSFPGEVVPAWVIDLFERRGEFDSLVVPAYFDLDERSKVVLFPQAVFLGLDGGFVYFGIDEANGQLCLGEKAEVFVPSELIGEPSVDPVFVDLTANYLGDGSSVKVRSAIFYVDEDSIPERGNFRGVALVFEGGEGIVFDPFSFSGIRIGVMPDLNAVLGGLPGVCAIEIHPRFQLE